MPYFDYTGSYSTGTSVFSPCQDSTLQKYLLVSVPYTYFDGYLGTTVENSLLVRHNKKDFNGDAVVKTSSEELSSKRIDDPVS